MPPTPDEPRGREFLTQVRPKAMEHLLAFFKESATHLDPKTRFLISIVTKVINYSPRGLKQYIKRAMEAGASRDEIIDAILCSYPCAGLTKVSDAAAVLLDYEESGGKPSGSSAKAASPSSDWHPLPDAEKIADGHVARCDAAGKHFCIGRKDGKLFALDDTCPHRGGSLSEGELAGDAVSCPLHGWTFRPADGSSAGIGKGGVAAYEVREAEGKVEIRVPKA